MIIVYALVAATAFGISDYLGGALSRKEQAERVTASAQLVTAVFYLGFAFLFPGDFSFRALSFGFISGVFTSFGLFLLYKTLAEGVVGVVASTAALCTALIPAAWGFLRGDTFTPYLALGIVFALVAVLFLTRDENHYSQSRSMTPQLWGLTLLAGIFLALSTISLSHTVAADGFWPLVGLSITAIPTAVLLAAMRTKGVFVAKSNFPILFAMAAIIALAYLGQINSVRAEVLAVASVVGALYPLPTILLARVIDKEQLTKGQKFGAALSLLAIIIIAIA